MNKRIQAIVSTIEDGKENIKQNGILKAAALDKSNIKDGKIYYPAGINQNITPDNNDLLVNKLKTWFKSNIPWLYAFLYSLFGAVFVGKSPQRFLKDYSAEQIIVNLGSGAKKIREDVIDIDFFPYPNVDIVASAYDLPFLDDSVDVIINEAVLEHTPYPAQMVAEMRRVIRTGGHIYVTVPFMAGFHSSPDDYYRWTKAGLKLLLQDFQEVESGIVCGPISGLVSIMSECLATLLCFSSLRVHQILFIFFTIILAPLKLLDYLIYRFPSSENAAYGFYFIGKKL